MISKNTGLKLADAQRVSTVQRHPNHTDHPAPSKTETSLVEGKLAEVGEAESGIY